MALRSAWAEWPLASWPTAQRGSALGSWGPGPAAASGAEMRCGAQVGGLGIQGFSPLSAHGTHVCGLDSRARPSEGSALSLAGEQVAGLPVSREGGRQAGRQAGRPAGVARVRRQGGKSSWAPRATCVGCGGNGMGAGGKDRVWDGVLLVAEAHGSESEALFTRHESGGEPNAEGFWPLRPRLARRGRWEWSGRQSRRPSGRGSVRRRRSRGRSGSQSQSERESGREEGKHSPPKAGEQRRAARFPKPAGVGSGGKGA